MANRKRQYELEYNGKTYKRDVSMLVLQAQMPAKYEDRTDLDPNTLKASSYVKAK